MIIVMLLGVAVAATAVLSKAQATARSATIISGIADLRQENNLTECQRVEGYTSTRLRKIQDSFNPIMWLGFLVTSFGIAGLVSSTLKNPKESANNELHVTNQGAP